MIFSYLIIAFGLCIIAWEIRRRKCPVCRATTAAGHLVILGLLLAAEPYVVEFGVPRIAWLFGVFVIGMFVDWLRIRLNRWLHTTRTDEDHLRQIRKEQLIG